MEENQNQGSSLFEMEVDPMMQEQLNSVSRWAKFIAITGFVMVGLCLLALLGQGPKIVNSFDTLMVPGAASALWVVVIILVIFGGLFVTWLYFLIQASSLIRKGLYMRNTDALTQGFKALRSFFTVSIIFSTIGIITTLFTILNS